MTRPRGRPLTLTPYLTPSDAPYIDDAMSEDEFNRLLDELDLSQLAAARLLGVHGRTIRRWAAGEVRVLPPVARFLRFLARAEISPFTVMETLAS